MNQQNHITASDNKQPAITIAIVGAGFSGVAVAARLLAQQDSPRLNIVLINASGKRARGVAYGTESASHVLNVPAGRMSIWSEKPDDFLQFLADRAHAEAGAAPPSGHDFVPRQYYGDYLEHVLHTAQQNSRHQLQHKIGRVVDIVENTDGTFSLKFAAGDELMAHKVVLALGNFLPQNPHLSHMTEATMATAYTHEAYLRDPWNAAAQAAIKALPNNGRVLLLGTGLSMLDVAMQLLAVPKAACN